MTLDEAAAHIGAGVVYAPYPYRGRKEKGVITSVNSSWVFVRYGADSSEPGRVQATDPAQLTLIATP